MLSFISRYLDPQYMPRHAPPSDNSYKCAQGKNPGSETIKYTLPGLNMNKLSFCVPVLLGQFKYKSKGVVIRLKH